MGTFSTPNLDGLTASAVKVDFRVGGELVFSPYLGTQKKKRTKTQVTCKLRMISKREQEGTVMHGSVWQVLRVSKL